MQMKSVYKLSSLNVKFKMAESLKSDSRAENGRLIVFSLSENINENTGIAQKYCENIIEKTFGYRMAQFF